MNWIYEATEDIINFVNSLEFFECCFLSYEEKLIVKRRICDRKSYASIGKEISRCGNVAKKRFVNVINKIRVNLIEPNEKNNIYDTTLCARAKNGLYGLGLNKMNDLKDHSIKSLLKARNLGPVSVEEINNYCKKLNILIPEK